MQERGCFGLSLFSAGASEEEVWGWGERSKRALWVGEADEDGFRAMMVELLKQMHLQKEVAFERAARVGMRRERRVRRSRGRRILRW